MTKSRTRILQHSAFPRKSAAGDERGLHGVPVGALLWYLWEGQSMKIYGERVQVKKKLCNLGEGLPWDTAQLCRQQLCYHRDRLWVFIETLLEHAWCFPAQLCSARTVLVVMYSIIGFQSTANLGALWQSWRSCCNRSDIQGQSFCLCFI